MGSKTNFSKIIFIDDDKEMAQIYRSILQRKKLSDYLIHFENAAHGLHYLKTKPNKELPSYIVLDLYMPQMNGFEFLKQFQNLNEEKKSIEIFVCSASNKKADRDKVMQYPYVSAFLEKPLSSDFLELLIKEQVR